MDKFIELLKNNCESYMHYNYTFKVAVTSLAKFIVTINRVFPITSIYVDNVIRIYMTNMRASITVWKAQCDIHIFSDEFRYVRFLLYNNNTISIAGGRVKYLATGHLFRPQLTTQDIQQAYNSLDYVKYVKLPTTLRNVLLHIIHIDENNLESLLKLNEPIHAYHTTQDITADNIKVKYRLKKDGNVYICDNNGDVMIYHHSFADINHYLTNPELRWKKLTIHGGIYDVQNVINHPTLIKFTDKTCQHNAALDIEEAMQRNHAALSTKSARKI